MLSVSVVVESSDLDGSQLVRAIGMEPDESKTKRPEKRSSDLMAPAGSWIIWLLRHPGVPSSELMHLRKGLSRISLSVRRKIGELADAGLAHATLLIVQKIDQSANGQDVGIYLDPVVISWMAPAQMALVVDQYVN